MLQEIYISVDIEASGPIPGEFSMLSIGACVVNNTSQTFYSELKPLNNNYLPKALEVSNLSLEKLFKEGQEPSTAMSNLESWINKISENQKPIFVAFNATFDWSFTHWYFIKFLGRDPFGISGLDIKAYFMGQQKVSWRETTKKHVKKLYPPNQAHTHNALDDALEQAQIFSQMLKANS